MTSFYRLNLVQIKLHCGVWLLLLSQSIAHVCITPLHPSEKIEYFFYNIIVLYIYSSCFSEFN